MTTTSDGFYARLPAFSQFKEFSNARIYTELPVDWWVAISDVKGSTEAIESGRYKQVNALGAASIIALLNAVDPIQVPYVFGGDGSTLCIPPSKREAVIAALLATRAMAEKSFGLGLRIGMVPMKDIVAAGFSVSVARYQPSDQFCQAMFMGGGLGYAEALVKQPDSDNPYGVECKTIEPHASFEGFECRWSEIPSPHDEVVSILVQANETEGGDQGALYSEIFKQFESIYGQEHLHHPVREGLMTLAMSLRDLATEIGVRTVHLSRLQRWLYTLKLELKVLAGKWLISRKVDTKTTRWSEYKKNFVSNTDYRKFDEVLRMVVSGTSDQREAFKAVLEQLHQQGKVVYGMHVSNTSLVTCLVRDYNADHVHFLDGSNGGYALAAKGLKAQLKRINASSDKTTG